MAFVPPPLTCSRSPHCAPHRALECSLALLQVKFRGLVKDRECRRVQDVNGAWRHASLARRFLLFLLYLAFVAYICVDVFFLLVFGAYPEGGDAPQQ